MSDNSIFNRNLVALSMRHTSLVSRITQASETSDLKFIMSRSGLPVPAIIRNGRSFPLHSRFDPEAEGRRQSEDAPDGYLIAFGLGGAYHLMPLLEKTSITGLVIVEADICFVRGILEVIDMTSLFADTRVALLVDTTPETLKKFILARYLPVLYGNLASINLRSRWDSKAEWFAEQSSILRELPESLGRDYLAQTMFGCRWFVNTVMNLKRSEQINYRLPPTKKLLITAAGPSLLNQLDTVRRLKRDGAVLLATDTSLPLLSSKKIAPDIVLSIDCQIVSYHHFFQRLPKETALILDLASPPVLTRLTDRILFYSSDHPFSLYLNQLYRTFPIIDITGGNVTYAAAAFADISGAQEVRLFGGDFSFPNGRPYAAGTYLFPYFQSQSTRLSCSETLFWQFIINYEPRREWIGRSWRWRTRSMDHYRESLEEAIKTMDYDFIQEPGSGVPISSHQKNTPPAKYISLLSAGPIKIGWKDFLAGYYDKLRTLPPLNGPPQDYLNGLEPTCRQAWATLLPAAAAFQKKHKKGARAVEIARQWTMEYVKTNLKR